MKPEFDEELLQEIRAYATKNGASWKNALAADWHRGRLADRLQALIARYGLRWLARFELPTASEGDAWHRLHETDDR